MVSPARPRLPRTAPLSVASQPSPANAGAVAGGTRGRARGGGVASGRQALRRLRHSRVSTCRVCLPGIFCSLFCAPCPWCRESGRTKQNMGLKLGFVDKRSPPIGVSELLFLSANPAGYVCVRAHLVLPKPPVKVRAVPVP